MGLSVKLFFVSHVEANLFGGTTYRALANKGHDKGMRGLLMRATERGTSSLLLEFHSLRELKTSPEN